MIILSGVLVVVAIALLIAGIVAGNSGTEVVGLDGLNLIYVSIGVSIVSALFLAIGVFLRRKDLFGPPSGPAARGDKRGKRGKGKAAKTGSESAPAQPAGLGATPGQPIAERTPDADTAELAAALPPAVDVPADAVVCVVPGRRRYHIDSCRQLAGRDKEELTFAEAREEGFSPCTACMPDTALAARAVSGGPATDKLRTEEGERPETGLGAEPASPPADDRDAAFDAFGSNGSMASAAGGAGPATEPFGRGEEDTPAAEEPGGETPTPADKPAAADDEAENPAGDAAKASDTGPDRGNPVPAVEVPQRAPGPAAAGKGGESASADGPEVRILSGTKRYHRPDCALIEDIGDEADDLESLTRAEAKARGCTPCLVCQPDKEPATRD